MQDNLKDLKDSISQLSGNSNQCFVNALKICCEFLNTDVGLISTVKDADYFITHFYPEDIGLEKGTRFSLGETYCDITLKTGKAVAIDHMSRSKYKLHPCYTSFKIESYIGKTYRLKNQTTGTINFSSLPPRTTPFNENDIACVQFITAWYETLMNP